MLRSLLPPLLLLKASSLRLSGPAVAAVVPVHEPHFKVLSDFLAQWRLCEVGRAAMDVFVVFSSQLDKEVFHGKFCAWTLQNRGSCKKPYLELVVTPSHVPYGAYKSWKKIDGLAQLLTLPEGTYEFALMMDAEIGLQNCAAFPQLLQRLRDKHAAKTIYGFSSDIFAAKRLMRLAACSLTPPSEAGIRLAALDRHSCSEEVLERLRPELGGGRWFTVYTWWNDLPFVHMETAQRMFDAWANSLEAAGYVPSHIAKTRSESAWAAGAANMLPDPQEVSAAMGVAPEAADEVNVAMGAFEHIIYQLYTVVYEGFHVVDLHKQEALAESCHGLSPGELFCGLSQEAKEAYVNTVEPLWQAHGCEPYNMSYGYPLLRFHMDRR